MNEYDMTADHANICPYGEAGEADGIYWWWLFRIYGADGAIAMNKKWVFGDVKKP